MKTIQIPSVIQSIGLACVPMRDMPPGEAALAQRPVAAAVITLQARADGHREIVASIMSDARDAEFPLPWLVDQALVAAVPAIISAEDRAMLGLDAMARRHWAEPRLAALCRGTTAIDPLALGGGIVADEVALYRRLQIPTAEASGGNVEPIWRRETPEPAMDVALAIAVARLMLWAHATSFADAEPDVFFETLLPLRDWMIDREKEAPSLHRAGRSRPLARASSFASTYHHYREARDAGDTAATYVQFEDGLFHT